MASDSADNNRVVREIAIFGDFIFPITIRWFLRFYRLFFEFPESPSG
jgi:hypothetical protein